MAVLSLFRHAKAAPPEVGQQDFDRPLTPRGRADAARAGEILSGVGIESALVSAARRTRETWEIAGRNLVPAPAVLIEDGLYLTSAASLIARLRKVPNGLRNVVAVGHNPCHQEVALWLAGRHGAAIHEKFPTSAIAIFDIPDGGWKKLSPDTARLRDFIIPRAD